MVPAHGVHHTGQSRRPDSPPAQVAAGPHAGQLGDAACRGVPQGADVGLEGHRAGRSGLDRPSCAVVEDDVAAPLLNEPADVTPVSGTIGGGVVTELTDEHVHRGRKNHLRLTWLRPADRLPHPGQGGVTGSVPDAQPCGRARCGQDRLLPALLAGTHSLLAERSPDRRNVRGRPADRAVPGQAGSAVLGQCPDLAGIGRPQTVLGASGQAEGHEGADRPGRGDGLCQSAQGDDVSASPAGPALHLLDQAHGADRIQSAQRHDSRHLIGGNWCQAVGVTLSASRVAVPQEAHTRQARAGAGGARPSPVLSRLPRPWGWCRPGPPARTPRSSQRPWPRRA